jgi:hypothetical protein
MTGAHRSLTSPPTTHNTQSVKTCQLSYGLEFFWFGITFPYAFDSILHCAFTIDYKKVLAYWGSNFS